MKLATEIFIEVSGSLVELRPSLREAILLERREGSFRQLLRDINEGSLGAALDIIAPHISDNAFLENRIFEVLGDIRPQLIEYVLACSGLDTDGDVDQPATKASSGKQAAPRSFADHLVDLYKTGTGWLGWTPEVTLNATPVEITLAFEGHIEMLKIVHGSATEAAPEDTRPVNEKFRSIFADLGTVKVEG